SHGRDKSSVFVLGSVWWMMSTLLLAVVQPEWPRWVLFVFVPLTGIGYAVVDLMPWSMLGEVIDEDDLASGERREGIYNGAFMFVRKLAGSVPVALAMMLLGWLGFGKGEEQPEIVVTTIRQLTTVVPALFLAIAVAFAWSYPLTRKRHAEIIQALEAREAGR
ncbi:MAG: MFS transporter, partial [Myxococcota bacterium]